MQLEEAVELVKARVEALPSKTERTIVALAGPPASGKSTLAERLAEELDCARMVPMDGFHLDNRLLAERGLLQRKGSPDTFDSAGFAHLIRRLKTEDEVIYPVFDRALDRSIAGVGQVDKTVRTIVVEGNYLLLDRPVWRDLKTLWDFSVFLRVSRDVLRDRLIERWRSYDYSDEDAMRKVLQNDLPNAETTANELIAPDLLLEETA